MLNITARAFGMSKPTEIFYSVKDGNWQDITVWETVSGRVGRIPSASDDVYIKHSVNIDTIINPLTSRITVCNNLFVSSSATFQCTTAFGSRFFQVGGDLKSKGTISWTGSGVNSLCLLGYNNEVDATKFNIGVSTVEYGGQSFEKPQYILNLPYAGLTIASYLRTGSPAKLAMGNLNLTTLSIGQYSSMDTLSFNLSVSGTTSIGGGLLYSTGNGSHLFVGLFSCPASGGCIFTGNPILEFRGGFSQTGNPVLPFNFGTGAMSLTTASQDWFSNQAFITFENPITIVGALAMSFRCLTINSTTNVWRFNNVITGDNASSSFLNKGNVWFGTTTAFSGFMTIGTHDFTTLSNVVGYIFNGNATLPYLTYQGLYIAGTGIKTLAGNTTISTTLSVYTSTFECSTYNLSVGTITTIRSGATFSKTGAGSLTFIGQFISPYSGGGGYISLIGNPSIEFRGGLALDNTPYTFDFGNGAISFTTNNQTIEHNIILTFNNNITITGAITVTTVPYGAGSYVINFYGTVNGTVGGSALLYNDRLNFFNTTLPMGTGTLTGSGTYAQIGYMANSTFSLPASIYGGGVFIGGTGIKTLSGTTSIAGVLNVAAGATLDCGIYDLSVTGATNILGTFSKTTSGSLLFVGQLSLAYPSAGYINFSGNPSVELRGGLFVQSATTGAVFNSGTGTWTLTTNNQSFTTNSSTVGIPMEGPVLISGAITITSAIFGGLGYWTFKNTLNGNNAASKWVQGASCITAYQTATRPMVTGILDCTTNANTWIYGLNNQDIKGGTYRILTLNGTGVKTLQGNVVVATTYTLTAPATLNLNGFTRT